MEGGAAPGSNKGVYLVNHSGEPVPFLECHPLVKCFLLARGLRAIMTEAAPSCAGSKVTRSGVRHCDYGAGLVVPDPKGQMPEILRYSSTKSCPLTENLFSHAGVRAYMITQAFCGVASTILSRYQPVCDAIYLVDINALS